MTITIELPDTNEQRLILLRDGVERGCKALLNNLNAPHYGSVPDFDAAIYGEKHLLRRTRDGKHRHRNLSVRGSGNFRQCSLSTTVKISWPHYLVYTVNKADAVYALSKAAKCLFHMESGDIFGANWPCEPRNYSGIRYLRHDT